MAQYRNRRSRTRVLNNKTSVGSIEVKIQAFRDNRSNSLNATVVYRRVCLVALCADVDYADTLDKHHKTVTKLRPHILTCTSPFERSISSTFDYVIGRLNDNFFNNFLKLTSCITVFW